MKKALIIMLAFAFAIAPFAFGGTAKADTGANLALSMTDSPNPVTPGGTIVYRMSVYNRGMNDAIGVTLSVPVPNNCGFMSFSAASDWAVSVPQVGQAGLITATLPLLPSRASATFYAQFQVGASMPNTANCISTVSVSSANRDTDYADNSATSIIMCVYPAGYVSPAPQVITYGSGYYDIYGNFISTAGTNTSGGVTETGSEVYNYNFGYGKSEVTAKSINTYDNAVRDDEPLFELYRGEEFAIVDIVGTSFKISHEGGLCYVGMSGFDCKFTTPFKATAKSGATFGTLSSGGTFKKVGSSPTGTAITVNGIKGSYFYYTRNSVTYYLPVAKWKLSK